MGFIVPKIGIVINPDRIKSILQIVFPHIKKYMQSFLGKINFVRIFIPFFAEIVIPMQDMVKKDHVFKWGQLQKDASEKIKEIIFSSPTLINPYFDKEFLLSTFVFVVLYVAGLTQKNYENTEIPISFMSFGF